MSDGPVSKCARTSSSIACTSTSHAIFGHDARCLICLDRGHCSHACSRAVGKTLAFRSLSPSHLEACRAQPMQDLEGNVDGVELSAADHVGGGNVTTKSRWFSCCRHDCDPAMRWATLTVDEETLQTRPIMPEDYVVKGIAVIDLAAATLRYDVSTPALTVAHGVLPRWRRVAWESSEVILERVPAHAILAAWSLSEVLAATPQELSAFDRNDSRWAAAIRACSPGDSDATVVEWAHWYELHAFVNDSDVPRPQWLPM